jgi:hypothetical protein
LGGLTRYAFLWTLPALAAYLLRYGGSRRFLLPIITVACALLVVAPWLARNYSICGTAFGTAGFSLSEGTTAYPEYQLQRSLAPDAGNLSAKPLAQKLLNNFRHQLSTDLPRFAGGWIGAFFLVSILIPFRFEAVPRIKFFILITFGLYFIAQALGRTQLAEETPETNSENLFILLAPIATAYGVSIFFLFLDQLEIPTRELRLAAIILFVAVCSLPMILNMLPPRPTPWAYPPYHPPSMQAASRWSRPDDLVMSDLPWATAWYGRSQCVWLTLKIQPDFFTINDYYKPIQEVYLTHRTLDEHYSSIFQGAIPNEWLKLTLDSILRRVQGQTGPPASFPLHYWQVGWPDLFLLTAREKPLRPE